MTRSHINDGKGGATRETTPHDGGYRDTTYKNGVCVDITDHDSKGESHTHVVGHGILGPYAGSKK